MKNFPRDSFANFIDLNNIHQLIECLQSANNFDLDKTSCKYLPQQVFNSCKSDCVMQKIIENLSSCLDIQTNCKVTKIDYSDKRNFNASHHILF